MLTRINVVYINKLRKCNAENADFQMLKNEFEKNLSKSVLFTSVFIFFSKRQWLNNDCSTNHFSTKIFILI